MKYPGTLVASLAFDHKIELVKESCNRFQDVWLLFAEKLDKYQEKHEKLASNLRLAVKSIKVFETGYTFMGPDGGVLFLLLL